MPELAKRFRAKLKRGSIVTDVGSTKYDIVKKLSTILSGRAHYLGSHPMAGSEKEGIDAAREDLFHKSVCILTPLPKARTAVVKAVYEFWKALGCQIRTMTPAEHDEAVAYISHLPHVLSAALVNCVGQRNPGAFQCMGNGFRDMTRLAGGSAELWTGIVASNREEIRRCLDRMMEELETLRRDLVNESDLELRAYLRKAKQTRDSWLAL
jgi:prephenate dehydrogenase